MNNLIINLNNAVEKELALEQQGFRRTRRWIGDTKTANEQLYRRDPRLITASNDHKSDAAGQVAETKPQLRQPGILARLFTPSQPHRL